MKTFAELVRSRVAALRHAITRSPILQPARIPGLQRAAAAGCLPAALVSVLAGLFPAPGGAAAAPEDLHSQIESVSRSSAITLELVHGQTVTGQFHGFLGDWRDPVDFDQRYESWRQARPEGLPRLGESMLIVLASGDTLRTAFKGVCPHLLVMGSGNTRYDNSYAFAALTEVHSDSGGAVVSWAELQKRLLDAPSFVGVGLERGDNLIVVSRENIVSVAGSTPAQSDSKVMLMAIAGCAAAVLVVVLCAQTANNASRDATSTCANGGSNAAPCTNAWLGLSGPDRKFGASNVSRGLEPWPAGETRRP